MAQRTLALLLALVATGWPSAAADAPPPPPPASAPATEDLTVLPAEIDGVPRANLLKAHLLRQVEAAQKRWQADYAKRTTPEAIAAYQKNLRERFVEAIGGFPERTPLNPTITGTIQREGYRVEKVIFESMPKFFVTAALFLPDAARHAPPYPGVIVPCGHAGNAKAYDTYQTMGALLALNGMAALVFDPIEQGERFQLLKEDGKPVIGGTTAHTMSAVGSILLGRNTARFEIWDGMRAIDYLASRPEVDRERIGCTGNSGGGTQTSYLMALDDRIKAAAPSCYITSLPALLRTIGPQDAEQNIFGQLAFGMDHADYLMMRAPIAIMVCAATKDFFDIGGTWDSFRAAKRLYTRLGFAERIDLMENDAEHNYNQLQRQSVIRWMARWLLRRDEPIVEPEIKLIPEAELNCTPRGQVMLLEGARSVHEINREYAKELAARRSAAWSALSPAERLAKVREVTGIRPLAELPVPTVRGLGPTKLVIEPTDGVPLPAVHLLPGALAHARRVVLSVHEGGKDAAASNAERGCAVLAVDVRGAGETQQTERPWAAEFGPNLREGFVAYLLGRSLMAMRAEDILVCARFAAENLGPESAGKRTEVHLVADGNTCVPALHAAALEPQLFASVTVSRSLCSWSNVLEHTITRDQLINAVHGALKVYDLPDLVALLGNKLKVAEPLDARGEPLQAPR